MGGTIPGNKITKDSGGARWRSNQPQFADLAQRAPAKEKIQRSVVAQHLPRLCGPFRERRRTYPTRRHEDDALASEEGIGTHSANLLDPLR